MKLRAYKRECIQRIKNSKKIDVDKLKFKHNFDTILEILSSVAKSKLDHIFCMPLPSDEETIDSARLTIYSNTLIEELRWLCIRCIIYKDEISKFLKIKEGFEQNLMFSDFDNCFHDLMTLHTQICYSEWSLKSLLLISELKNGTSGNKETYEYLSKKIKSPNINLILYFSSLRYEQDITATKYQSYVNMHLKQYDRTATIPVGDYAKYQLLPYYGDEHISYMINSYFLERLSCIDTYLGLKRIFSQIVLYDKQSLMTPDLLKAISTLKKEFDDPYWGKLENVLHCQCQNKYDNEVYDQCLCYFFNKQYVLCYELALRTIIKKPLCFDLYPLLIKSVKADGKSIDDVLDRECILKRILKTLEDINRKDDTYYTSLERLCKMSLFLDISELGTILNLYVRKEKTFYSDKNIKLLTLLFSQFTIFEEAVYYRDDITLDPLKLYSENVFYYLDYLINQQKYVECVNWVDASTSNIINDERFDCDTKCKIVQQLVLCHCKMQDYLKATQLIVNFYFRYNLMPDSLYYYDLAQKLIELDGNSIYKNIELPILFSLYNLKTSHIYDSIANFLIANDLKNPSELKVPSLENRQLLIYFLDKVCAINNLEDSPYLNTIDKIEAERIKILNYLTAINPSDNIRYNNEIFEITQRATIRECLKNIYDSRIFVDTNNIKKILTKEYRDNFERYLTITDCTFQDFSTFSLNSEDEIIARQSQKYITITFYFDPPISNNEYEEWEKLDDGPIKKSMFMDRLVEVPYSRFLSFKEMFNTTQNHFLFNEDFGLKYFLSMRIRHGFLPNLLKSAFEKHSLLLERGTEDNKVTMFWENKLRDNNLIKYKSQFIELLLDFASSINTITQVGVSWVKIKENDNDTTSLFDIKYTESDLLSEYHNLGHINDLDKLIDEFFKLLWRKVDEVLCTLKDKFEHELSDMYIEKINEFKIKCDTLFGDKSFTFLNNTLTACTTDTQGVIKKAHQWFNISKNRTIGRISFASIINTSIEYLNIINTENFSNKIKCKKEIDFPHEIKGELFDVFGDLFNTLLGNVIKHTKDISRVECLIQISIIDNKNFKLTIQNTSNKKNSELSIEKITKMLNDKNGEYESSFEGGSGFPKIKKLVSSRDINATDYTFNIIDNNKTFSIEIILPYKNIIAHETINN